MYASDEDEDQTVNFFIADDGGNSAHNMQDNITTIGCFRISICLGTIKLVVRIAAMRRDAHFCHAPSSDWLIQRPVAGLHFYRTLAPLLPDAHTILTHCPC